MHFRLKTWLRSQIWQKKLTGLALMHVFRNIHINVDRFAKNKRKPILLYNYLYLLIHYLNHMSNY
jgi:hypothetical protein